jgi:hypothetical protein
MPDTLLMSLHIAFVITIVFGLTHDICV